MKIRVCKEHLRFLLCNSIKTSKRDYSNALSTAEAKSRRYELFEAERARQLSFITRVEKIRVEYTGKPEPCTLIMNRDLSTPYNCAMHVQELMTRRSVVALVDGQPWDMHRPLEHDCKLEFTHFKCDDPFLANNVFWRSCSFILGYILENSFKDKHKVELCSFPGPRVKSGSFVYDANLEVGDWKPNQTELKIMSRLGGKLAYQDLRFERLEIDASVAKDIFAHDRFKLQQIPSIAAQSASGHKVVVYRMGDHVDMTRGPLMGSTWLLSRFSITAMHPIESQDYGNLTRVQGLAMPKELPVHYYVYDLLAERAANLNSAPLPRRYDSTELKALNS